MELSNSRRHQENIDDAPTGDEGCDPVEDVAVVHPLRPQERWAGDGAGIGNPTANRAGNQTVPVLFAQRCIGTRRQGSDDAVMLHPGERRREATAAQGFEDLDQFFAAGATLTEGSDAVEAVGGERVEMAAGDFSVGVDAVGDGKQNGIGDFARKFRPHGHAVRVSREPGVVVWNYSRASRTRAANSR